MMLCRHSSSRNQLSCLVLCDGNGEILTFRAHRLGFVWLRGIFVVAQCVGCLDVRHQQ